MNTNNLCLLTWTLETSWSWLIEFESSSYMKFWTIKNENTLIRRPLGTSGNVGKFPQKWISQTIFSEKFSQIFKNLRIFSEKKDIVWYSSAHFWELIFPNLGNSLCPSTLFCCCFFSHRCGQGISQNSQTRTDFAKWSLSVEILCLEKT